MMLSLRIDKILKVRDANWELRLAAALVGLAVYGVLRGRDGYLELAFLCSPLGRGCLGIWNMDPDIVWAYTDASQDMRSLILTVLPIVQSVESRGR